MGSTGSDILTADLGTQRRFLVEGRLGAGELMRAALARIEAINPALNAVVALDRQAALAAAAKAEQRFASGEARPLEGLPITVKDAFDVAGIVSTAGAPSFATRVPETDAGVVARLRRAGAIVIGKSTCPMFSGDFQTYNAVYGTTNNPFDLTRSPGGSSGGAAAAVSTGMSAFELGSDLGGSIRWPAHACGIFGLKPSWGLVSTKGHVPPPPGFRQPGETDLAVAGPLARSAADLDVLLAILAGPADPAEPATALAPPRREGVEGLRVALWLDEPSAPVERAVRQAVQAAAARLSEAGAIVEPKARPGFGFMENFEAYALLNHAIVAAGLPEAVRDRIAAGAAGFAADDLSHPALQARGARLSPETYQRILATRRKVKQAWATFFADYDVVLCPPAPVVAIPHDHEKDVHKRRLMLDGTPRPYLDFLLWASLATFAHLPAASVPVSLTAQGLPAGVQLIGPEGGDRSVIAVARMLEALGCRAFLPPIIG